MLTPIQFVLARCPRAVAKQLPSVSGILWAIYDGPEEGRVQLGSGPTEGVAWVNARQTLIEWDNLSLTPVMKRQQD